MGVCVCVKNKSWRVVTKGMEKTKFRLRTEMFIREVGKQETRYLKNGILGKGKNCVFSCLFLQERLVSRK